MFARADPSRALLICPELRAQIERSLSGGGGGLYVCVCRRGLRFMRRMWGRLWLRVRVRVRRLRRLWRLWWLLLMGLAAALFASEFAINKGRAPRSNVFRGSRAISV